MYEVKRSAESLAAGMVPRRRRGGGPAVRALRQVMLNVSAIARLSSGRKDFSSPRASKLSTILGLGKIASTDNCFRFEGLLGNHSIRYTEAISRFQALPAFGKGRNYCVQSPTICAGARIGAKHMTSNYEGQDLLPFAVRGLRTQTPQLARQRSANETDSEGGLTRQEDPFDSITDKIPEKPVTVAEGASYSVVILIGLALAGTAAYAVFKELIFEPKEYKVFGKALDRVQRDNQVSARLGAPITGYGQESRNRAARQRISNRAWTDEVGIERVEVMFHIRGPGGAGKVYSEMFKDPEDKVWKYTYLIVDILSPYPTRLMLESYVPPLAPLNAL